MIASATLPNDNILQWSKLKALRADDKIKVTEKIKFAFEMIENILGKGENAGNRHFLLFPKYFLLFQNKYHFHNIFKRLHFQVYTSRDCVVKSLYFPR